MVFAYVLYTALSVAPKVQATGEKAESLVLMREQVVEAEKARAADQRHLEGGLSAARRELDEKLTLLLSTSRASETLDCLYEYAEQSSVRIITLEKLPSPQQTEGLFNVESFHVQANGPPSELFNFICQMREATSYRAFLLSNLSIDANEAEGVLTMDVRIYTSSERARQTPLATTSSAPTAWVTPTPHPYLVRPKDWPANWPWPPRKMPAEENAPRP